MWERFKKISQFLSGCFQSCLLQICCMWEGLIPDLVIINEPFRGKHASCPDQSVSTLSTRHLHCSNFTYISFVEVSVNLCQLVSTCVGSDETEQKCSEMPICKVPFHINMLIYGLLAVKIFFQKLQSSQIGLILILKTVK